MQQAWSTSGLLTSGNTVNKVTIQAKFPEAQVYTVQIGVDYNTAIQLPAATAEVEWTVSGNTVRRQISLGQGTSISGNGEAVRVVITDRSVGTPGLTYPVTILIAPGNRAGSIDPSYFADEIDIAAAGTTTVSIPDVGCIGYTINTKLASGVGGAIAAATYWLQELTPGGAVIRTWDLSAINQGQVIRLPAGGISQFKITNGGGADIKCVANFYVDG